MLMGLNYLGSVFVTGVTGKFEEKFQTSWQLKGQCGSLEL